VSPPAGHIVENRRFWNRYAPDWVEMGHRAWASDPSWGIWSVAESQLGLLPDRLDGRASIELGCGTGYVSSWLARRGAAATGIDLSEEQLATAAQLRNRHGLAVGLVHGNAEQTPFPDERFDFAISEYGAAIWCDPRVWVPEARRLLRPGGRLVVYGNHPIAQLCMPPDGSGPTSQLHRAYFELGRMDWTDAEVDPGGIEFHLPTSEWVRLFTDLGFTVDRYLEIRAPEGDERQRFGTDRAWARQWPAEQAWSVSLPPA
jgi:SAM-dependent methyltransferase